MGKFWSCEVDSILGVGRSLEDIGVRNWALNQEDSLTALIKLTEIGIAVLGGDVYSVNGEFVESNYDNWYCNRDEHESDLAFVERSIIVARSYITNYKTQKESVLFAIVPDVRRTQ